MRNIIITTITFLIIFDIAKAQVNCPPGSEKRNIKCNGQIVTTCVPINYDCRNCWNVENPPCDGNISGGLWSFNSYEKALQAAERLKAENNHCPFYNDQIYKIYLDDSKYCNNSELGPGAGQIVSDDFTTKLNSLFKSWGLSLADAYIKFKEYYSGPTLPELTQVTTEYGRFLQQAAKNLKKLQELNDDYTNEKMNEIEEQFNEFENQYNAFQESTNSFKNNVSKTIQNDNSWKSLPDGTYYRILPNGMYSFFDGIDQIETVSASEGEQMLSKHQLVDNSSAKTPTNTEEIDTELNSLRTVVDMLNKNLSDMKQGDNDPEIIKQTQESLDKIEQQIKELEKNK